MEIHGRLTLIHQSNILTLGGLNMQGWKKSLFAPWKSSSQTNEQEAVKQVKMPSCFPYRSLVDPSIWDWAERVSRAVDALALTCGALTPFASGSCPET